MCRKFECRKDIHYNVYLYDTRNIKRLVVTPIFGIQEPSSTRPVRRLERDVTFPSDEGPSLETLNLAFRIPTVHQPFYISIYIYIYIYIS